MKKLFLIVLLLTINIFSQGRAVTGVVTDSISKAPLQDANILATSLPDSIVYGTTSNSSGYFIIEKLPSGKYNLSVRFVGYNTYNSEFQIKKNSIDLGTIELSEKNIETDSVLVIEELPPVVLNADTVEYNSDAYKTREDEYAKDLVKKLAGISMQGDKIYVGDKEVSEVFVDKKKFLLDKPDEVLKKIPAKVVDKVQVYDKKSKNAEFSGIEDGVKEKVLNLITKRNSTEGLFGKANIGYGSSDKYSAGGNLNLMTEESRIGISTSFSNSYSSGYLTSGIDMPFGFPLNVLQSGKTNRTYFKLGFNKESWKDLKLGLSYRYSPYKRELNSITNRTYKWGSLQDQVYLENNYSNSSDVSHSFNAEIEYKIDSLTAVSFSPEVTISNIDDANNLSGLQTVKSQLLSSTITNSNSESNNLQATTSLMINRKLSSKGRTLLANFRFSDSNDKSNKKYYSENLFYDIVTLSDTLNQFADDKHVSLGFSSSITYQEPIDSVQNMSINFLYSYGKSKMDNITTADIYRSVIDTSLSNLYNNYQKQYAVNVGYNYKNKNFDFSSYLKYNIYNIKNNQDLPYNMALNKTFNYPNAQLNFGYKLSQDKFLSLSFFNLTMLPSASQLQTVVDNRNPIYLVTGNPNLDKMDNYNLSMIYRSINISDNSFFVAQCNFNFWTNKIGNNRIEALRDTVVLNNIVLRKGQQISYPVNLGTVKQIGVFTSYSFPISEIKSKIEFDLKGDYSTTPTLVNNIETNAKSYGLAFGLKLSGDFSDLLSYNYSGYVGYNKREFGASTVQNDDLMHYHAVNMKSLLFERVSLYSTFYIYHNNSIPQELGSTSMILVAGFGIKLFTDRSGEIRFEGYDLTNENSNNIYREYDSYVESTSSNTIGRYFLLRFVYQLKNFWGAE